MRIIQNFLAHQLNDLEDIVYNHCDPFNEEDWDEVETGSFLIWLKTNYPDESKWKDITAINCYNQKLTDLIGIEKFINLEELSCAYNQLTELDVTKNINLRELFCYNNQLTELDVSKNVNLINLYCSNNQLTKLNVTKNILKFLYCDNNQLTELDLSTKLKYCSYENNPLVVVRKSKFHFRRFFKKPIVVWDCNL